jgi:DNA-binding SARP family transcriptional activator
VHYRILGTLELATHDGDVVTVNSQKVRTVLATLLIHANQVVSLQRLIDELWGEHPPKQATAGLHVYVSQLRKLLVAADARARPAQPVITRAPGYLIQVGPDQLDLHVFQRLVQQGRLHQRAGRHDKASTAFSDALALWRGPILSDLHTGPLADAFVNWLEELRLECTEMFVESGLMLGRHRELIGFLRRLVADHPFREVFYQQLMLALYRCDRRAEALAVYQTAENTITAELGLDPCRALQELHHAILSTDDRLIDRPAI